MKPEDDSFWDELGIAWRASVSNPDLVQRNVERRLHIQRALLAAGTIVAAGVAAASLGLAAWSIWAGWTHSVAHFLTRGATLAVVSVLATVATFALRSRNEPAHGSLREMTLAAAARTERLIRAADLGCLALVVLVVGGLLGYGLRLHSGRPPALPASSAVLALLVAGLVLVMYRRDQKRALAKFRHLTDVFSDAHRPA
jgi:hypothetical protein